MCAMSLLIGPRGPHLFQHTNSRRVKFDAVRACAEFGVVECAHLRAVNGGYAMLSVAREQLRVCFATMTRGARHAPTTTHGASAVALDVHAPIDQVLVSTQFAMLAILPHLRCVIQAFVWQLKYAPGS